MIIIDKKLEELNNNSKPIRVGLVGAGFAAKGFMLQLITSTPGMRLSAVSNRTIDTAEEALKELNASPIRRADNQSDLDSAIKSGEYVITDNPMLLCSSSYIDVIVEATGEVEFGAKVAMEAIKNKKHIVLINAELDATLGPILKKYADDAGVIYTQGDGDQPAVLMNLIREVKMWGFKPILAGNIKSLIDARRTPETQKAFAEAHFQRPKMITSFADGTKIAMEMATIGNAVGFGVGKRGMFGHRCERVEQAVNLFPFEEIKDRPIVDYILGAEPSFGVFVLAYSEHPIKQRYMKVYKMGNGPVYTFYRPYHLSPIEAPASVARAVLMKDATLAPAGRPFCDVITLAKKDLKKGEVLDGIGGFTCYGVIENYDVSLKENLLPMGLTDGCVLKRDIKQDEVITYADVELPDGHLSDKLREEQTKHFKNG